ncbi:MAG: hypothetical protein H6867_07175 [Rhodospirillales bacterium]|nr:hypothetical protein [Rhodospirillales bacterium]MCB9995332.1 hypothetical protein [Rhodospirillales bacterium]
MAKDDAEGRVYFTASSLKLVLLSVFTFGYYEFYWFYRNWLLFKVRTGQNIMPVWRATLTPVFAYSLFKDIEDKTALYDRLPYAGAAALAVAYFVLFLLHFLPEPFDLVSVLTIVPMVLANRMAGAVNRAHISGYKENGRFGVLNVAALFFGGIFVALSVAAKFYDGPSLFEISQQSGFSFGTQMQSRLGQ